MSEAAALQVTQQAIAALLDWVDQPLPAGCQTSISLEAVDRAVGRAQMLLEWTTETRVGPLQLVFDQVRIRKGQGLGQPHWCAMEPIADEYPTIPYPSKQPPSQADQQALRDQIRDQVLPLLADNWENLSLLSLILEKYGSGLSFGTDHVALVDMARITGAVAAALALNPEASKLSLVAGDFSGIQSFIYTISSAGAPEIVEGTQLLHRAGGDRSGAATARATGVARHECDLCRGVAICLYWPLVM